MELDSNCVELASSVIELKTEFLVYFVQTADLPLAVHFDESQLVELSLKICFLVSTWAKCENLWFQIFDGVLFLPDGPFQKFFVIFEIADHVLKSLHLFFLDVEVGLIAFVGLLVKLQLGNSSLSFIQLFFNLY